jgi:glycosyltransferase involved in cell wall biosynthesis
LSSLSAHGATELPLPHDFVSVCLPTHNGSRYIRETLESVLGQSHDKLELVIVDNASTDATRQIVTSFSDQRIRYIRGETVVPVAQNWIRALTAARAPLRAVIHDDDTWEPAFLARCVTAMNDPDVAVAFCDHWLMDQGGRRLEFASEEQSRRFGRSGLAPGRHLPFEALAVGDQAISVTAALIRASALRDAGALDPRAGYVIDFYIFARLAATGAGAFYIPERLASTRTHAEAISRTHHREIWPDMQWACSHLYPLISPDVRPALRRKWAAALTWELWAILSSGDWRAAGSMVWRSLRLLPAGARLQVSALTMLLAASRAAARARRQLRMVSL